MLSGYSEPRSWNRLSLAPYWLKDRFIHLIARERMVHQDITLPDLRKHIRVLRQLRHSLGRQIALLFQMVETLHAV